MAITYATMKIKIAIENGRSLKLRQTRQVNASESLSSTTSTQPTTNKGYTAHQWAVRRVRSG